MIFWRMITLDLGTLFDCAVSRYPNLVTVVQDNRCYTFLQLYEKVNRLASSLQKLGVNKRDRVMLLLKNRLESVCLFWAIQKLGAIFTPITSYFKNMICQCKMEI